VFGELGPCIMVNPVGILAGHKPKSCWWASICQSSLASPTFAKVTDFARTPDMISVYIFLAHSRTITMKCCHPRPLVCACPSSRFASASLCAGGRFKVDLEW